MIIDKQYEAFDSNGVLDLSKVDTSGKAGKAITFEKSFKAHGVVIPGSETPFGRCGLRVQVIQRDPVGTPVAGSGNLVFELYDEDPATDGNSFTNKVASWGPFTTADIQKATQNNVPLLDAAVPPEARGRLRLKALGSTSAGTTFSAGKLYCRYVPNV